MTPAFQLPRLPPLSANDITKLVNATDPLKNLDPSIPTSHLSKILIPRVSGTENSLVVRNHIVSTLKALNWHVELDEFLDTTPLGPKRFANIIATKDPQATRRFVLSAHYDSKYFANFQFVGATDSAASCAMMLDLAEALNPLLEKQKKRVYARKGGEGDTEDMTLQLVFFDGEEAFGDWSDSDSLYGSRHLAEKWATTRILQHHKKHPTKAPKTEIQGIEHLIILDLLGARDPIVRSNFPDTAWLFDAMASAERRLGDSGAFVFGNQTDMAPGKWKSYFLPRATTTEVKIIPDDHIPFLKRGVSVLHVIPVNIPVVWHKNTDDAAALDLPTIRRWSLILRVFMSEYLNLHQN